MNKNRVASWTKIYIAVACVVGFCGLMCLWWFPVLQQLQAGDWFAPSNPNFGHFNRDAILHNGQGLLLWNQYGNLLTQSFMVEHFPQFIIYPVLVALLLTHTVRVSLERTVSIDKAP